MCCSVLQCVAVCCSGLQCVAVCCSVLQCVAVCCNTLCILLHTASEGYVPCVCTTTRCNTLQHAATRCNTLQTHTATHCKPTLQHTASEGYALHWYTTTHCNALQHTATHSALQHYLWGLCAVREHYNTLQHTATLVGALNLHRITSFKCFKKDKRRAGGEQTRWQT